MREGNIAVEEEQKQEEMIPVSEVKEEQPVEPAADIVPEPEEETTDAPADSSAENTDEQEAPVEKAEESAEEAAEEPAAEEAAEESAEEEPAAEESAVEEPAAEEPAEEASEEPAAEETPAAEKTASQSKALPYHERYYLKYREGKRSTPLDLKGTRDFLQSLGIDGGELRQAREGKNRAASFRNADQSRNNQMFCSYCGAEISGVEFSRLPDGRMRCTACSETVVITRAEAEALCQRVIDNMANFFGAVVDVPVSVEIVEERKLKKKIGGSLDRQDMQSILILGCAIEKKKKYTILLENGAPRISTITTFAHELTHIWQYTHWKNNKKLKKYSRKKLLLLYEGMAKWTEIQYLYLIGETNAARREENIARNRQDEYGLGFRMYEEEYPISHGAMGCENTPFTPDKYPFD